MLLMIDCTQWFHFGCNHSISPTPENHMHTVLRACWDLKPWDDVRHIICRKYPCLNDHSFSSCLIHVRLHGDKIFFIVPRGNSFLDSTCNRTATYNITYAHTCVSTCLSVDTKSSRQEADSPPAWHRYHSEDYVSTIAPGQVYRLSKKGVVSSHHFCFGECIFSINY